jgi:L-asparaginase
MKIKIFTVGGTIDKVYFDQKSEYQVGDPGVTQILREANITVDHEWESLMRKDSLDLTEDDRRIIAEKIRFDNNERVLVTHGTDTMMETARFLQQIPEKTIVLTGAMSPARFKESDAPFNIGFAMAAVQLLPSGVYLAMNGRIFTPDRVVKNRERNCFEEI